MAAETNGETPAPAPASVVPKWIEASIFEGLLKSQYADFVKVKEFKALPAMAPGENYAALMLRVEIEVELEGGKSKTLNYMMKVPHDNDFSRLVMENNNFFTVELGMYNDIVPEFEALYREAGLEVKFGAESYSFPDIKRDYVLLEDLRPRGFKNANRLEGLDMDHTKSVLKKLAQWHAASAVRVETKGKYSDTYTIGFFSEKSRPMMEQVTSSVSGAVVQCMETYKGNEVYIEDAKKIQANIVDILYKNAKIDSNDFNVLNHGDCWCNNIMFQYDAFGKIKETYFVDYQIPKYGTPAQDLLYFLISSTKFEIKLKEFDYFIKYYHDQLVEHLKLLKYPKKLPPLRLIHSMLYKYGVWGYSTATGVMGIVLLDPTDKANIENFVGDSDDGNQFKLLMYSNNRYRKHIEVVLPWLHNRGGLEL